MNRSWSAIAAAFICLALGLGLSQARAQELVPPTGDGAQPADPFGAPEDLEDGQNEQDVDDLNIDNQVDGTTQPVQLNQNQPFPQFEGLPATPERTELGALQHTVRLDQNGNLRGRLGLIDPQSRSLIPAQDLQIYFLRDGRVAQRVTPGPGGQFVVENLSPGVYSVVAQGPAGFAAFAVQVLPFDPRFADEPTELALQGTLIPTTDLMAIPPGPGMMPPPIGAPGFGGPMGGGGGFTGGGGGGLGGLGSIAGFAGLAGLAGLIDDDDEEVRRIIIASPAAP